MSKTALEINHDQIVGFFDFLQKPETIEFLKIVTDATEEAVFANLIPENQDKRFEKVKNVTNDLISKLLINPTFANQYFKTIKSIMNNSDDKENNIGELFILMSNPEYLAQAALLLKLQPLQKSAEKGIRGFEETIDVMINLTTEEKQDLLNNAETQSETGSVSSGNSGYGFSQKPGKIFTPKKEINCKSDFVAAVQKIFPEFKENETRIPEYSEADKKRFEDLQIVIEQFADKLAIHAFFATGRTALDQASMVECVNGIKLDIKSYFIPKILGQTEQTIARSSTIFSDQVAKAIKEDKPISQSGQLGTVLQSIAGRV